jgi:hypothetical protein
MARVSRQEKMATQSSVTYYKTWDNINQRYLVKKDMDDEWELSPTPDVCCTKGRKFNHTTGIYHPPPFKKGSPLRTWHDIEGRWIFEVTVMIPVVKMKETAQEKVNNEGEEENENVDTKCFRLNITDVRKKYF